MNFDELYNFFFQSYAGIGCLVGIVLVISLLLCFVMERRTRKRFADRKKTEDDRPLFDDDEDEAEDADR